MVQEQAGSVPGAVLREYTVPHDDCAVPHIHAPAHLQDRRALVQSRAAGDSDPVQGRSAQAIRAGDRVVGGSAATRCRAVDQRHVGVPVPLVSYELSPREPAVDVDTVLERERPGVPGRVQGVIRVRQTAAHRVVDPIRHPDLTPADGIRRIDRGLDAGERVGPGRTVVRTGRVDVHVPQREAAGVLRIRPCRVLLRVRVPVPIRIAVGAVVVRRVARA